MLIPRGPKPSPMHALCANVAKSVTKFVNQRVLPTAKSLVAFLSDLSDSPADEALHASGFWLRCSCVFDELAAHDQRRISDTLGIPFLNCVCSSGNASGVAGLHEEEPAQVG